MKTGIAFFPLLFLTIFFLCQTAWGTYQLEYTIEVYADGSATWIIEHRFLKGQDEALFRQLSDWTYFSDTFVKNMKLLVNTAKVETGRTNMTAEKFVMTTNVSGSYSVVRHQFRWRGFAKIEDKRISIGDVFQVEGLFLYGEGRVNIMYPLEYVVHSVSPRPHIESDQMLTWYGINDFEMGEPKIVLGEEKANSGFLGIMKENALMIGSLIAIGGVSSISLYYFIIRKREMKRMMYAKAPVPSSVPGIEDDEEKVINLLKAAGGSLYQSTIAEHCGFSRAKTSKLLKSMESEGKIKRKEKGREKIVTLMVEVTKSQEKKNGGRIYS